MTVDRDTKQTILDWSSNVVLRVVIGSARMLPLRKRVPAMGWFTQNCVAPLAGYRDRASKNLKRIYPDKNDIEIRALANKTANNVGRTLIENYSGKSLGKVAQDAPIVGEGLAALKQAKAEGKPVLLVTGHLFFNDHYERTMAGVSGPVFAQGRRGTAQFVRYLKDGGTAVLLFDIHAKGVKIPFMGKRAHTSTSSADLALKYGAVVIPFFGVRQPDGISFEVQLDAPIPHSTPQSQPDHCPRIWHLASTGDCHPIS